MKNKAFPISMTVLWGMVFGSAMHSLTMGICMGLMMGIAFGLFDSDKNDKQEQGKGAANLYLPLCGDAGGI